MRWFPILTSLSVIILLGADSLSDSSSQEIELLQFHSQNTANKVPITATFHGADHFKVTWRLQEANPQQLFISNDNAAYYQSNNQWKSVLPSGERQTVKQNANLPTPVNSPAWPNLQVTEHSLTLFEGSQIRWTYSLPENIQIRPNTVQFDAAEHLLFQDNNGSLYSLDYNGKERYKVILQASDTKFVCKAAPSGDAFCLSPDIGVFAVKEQTNAPRLIIDGKERFFTQHPEIVNGRTFVPLRSIFEAMQSKVDWDEETMSVTAIKGKRTITLTLNSDNALLNGKKIQIEAPPMLINSNMYVPLRLVGEALGAAVIWEDATRTIQIVSK